MMKFRTLTEFPNGSKPEYTFFTDFDIAGHFGNDAIQDTYNRVCKSWKDNYKALTEAAICLNILSWDYYRNGKLTESELYANLYYRMRDFVYDTYSGNEEALDHFYNMTN